MDKVEISQLHTVISDPLDELLRRYCLGLNGSPARPVEGNPFPANVHRLDMQSVPWESLGRLGLTSRKDTHHAQLSLAGAFVAQLYADREIHNDARRNGKAERKALEQLARATAHHLTSTRELLRLAGESPPLLVGLLEDCVSTFAEASLLCPCEICRRIVDVDN